MKVSIIYESDDENIVIHDYDNKISVQTFSTGGWLGRGAGFLDRQEVKRLVDCLNKWLIESEE